MAESSSVLDGEETSCLETATPNPITQRYVAVVALSAQRFLNVLVITYPPWQSSLSFQTNLIKTVLKHPPDHRLSMIHAYSFFNDVTQPAGRELPVEWNGTWISWMLVYTTRRRHVSTFTSSAAPQIVFHRSSKRGRVPKCASC